MEDSDRRSGNFELEELWERVARRKLLVGTAALGGGVFLSNQSDTNHSTNEERLAQAETRLVELASKINGTDLKNPQRSLGLQTNVSEAVELVRNVLNQDLPNDPQTEQRVSALRTATDYYDTLANTLESATTLLTQVADLERLVLTHEGTLDSENVTEVDTAAFDNSISRLAEAEKDSGAITSQERKLVPDQKQVIDSLRGQLDVFERNLTAQQTYLDTATAIETGIRAHEETRFDSARSTLSDAHESLTTGIPETGDDYRLSDAGLSLAQYVTLLSLRQTGVSKLLDVSEASVSEQRRQSASDEAIDHLFEGRRIVTG